MHKCFDEYLARRIENIFHEFPKGHRYIKDQLKRRFGLVYNDKTILRYMKILHLECPIRKKKYVCCTQQEINEKARIVCNNVLARNFQADRPLLKLVTDVSYVYHQQGRMFISVIKDLYDNSILAYNLSKYNDNSLVFENMKMVFNEVWDSTNICILHSDQGFQYTNRIYIENMDNLGVTVSHSRKGNCYDNACCENFFSHLKGECLELTIPKDEEGLKKAVREYILFYNTDRPQRKLKGMTPLEFRSSYQ